MSWNEYLYWYAQDRGGLFFGTEKGRMVGSLSFYFYRPDRSARLPRSLYEHLFKERHCHIVRA